MATEAHQLDEAKVEEFLGKAVGDFSAAMTVVVASLADRAGLFKDLARNGPGSAADIAQRTGNNERYVTEALRGLATAGYVERDAEGRYVLPPEHVPVLAEEAGPMFLAGGFQMFAGIPEALDRVLDAFKNGGGAPQSAYGSDFWDGMQRFTAAWFEHLLLGEWMPKLPHLDKRLKAGATLADVGCGAGRALLKYAEAYPSSTFVGYDAFEGQIERAKANADAAGVGDRVRFELLDVAQGLPEQYDIVTTFDVIHDAVDPRGLLKAIRGGTKDDGSYLMLEINCADRHEDNEGPLAAMFYGFSVTYCMTTSLANGGEGLGTCGMPEAKVRELGEEAGFSRIERVEMENPFNSLFELRP